MGAATGTVVASTEFPGKHKLVVITAPIASSSDTITVTEDSIKAVGFVGVIGAVITGGLGSGFSMLQVTFTGLVITVASFKETGAAADAFTGTTVSITMLAKTST